MTRPKLEHFSPTEFGIWYPVMDAEVLKKIDALRARRKSPIFISTAQGGLGREVSESDKSQHNVLRWGEVRAIDFFATVPAPTPKGWRYITTPGERRELFDDMKAVGFTGIGIYTDTKRNGDEANMGHGDTRRDRQPGKPATWARVDGRYTGIGAVTV